MGARKWYKVSWCPRPYLSAITSSLSLEPQPTESVVITPNQHTDNLKALSKIHIANNDLITVRKRSVIEAEMWYLTTN